MRWLALLFLFISLKSEALDLQYFKFTHNPTYSSTDNALLNKSFVRNDYPWLLNVAYDYVKVPFSQEQDNTRFEEIVRNQNSLSLGAAWHPRHDLLVGLRTHFSRLASDKTGTFMGDSVVEGLWKFYENDQTAIALHPKIMLPTGSHEYTTQSRKVGEYLGLNLERKFTWLQAVLNVGYAHQPGARLDLGSSFSKIDYREAIFTAIGAIFPLAETWALSIEGYRYNQFRGNQHPNEVYLGLRKDLTAELTGFTGLSTGGLIDESSNDYRFSIGLKYYPGAAAPLEKIVHIDYPSEPKKAPLSKRKVILDEEEMLYGKLVLAENVYFANDSIVITDLYQGLLDKLADKVKSKEHMTIVLEGFASAAGTGPANMILSKKRAVEVRKYLRNAGAQDAQVKSVAYGDSRAEAGVNEALNRKVMIRVYEK